MKESKEINKNNVEDNVMLDINIIEKSKAQETQFDDPLVEFVSDMAEAESLDLSDETLDLIKTSVLEDSFEFSGDLDAIASEILDEHQFDGFA